MCMCDVMWLKNRVYWLHSLLSNVLMLLPTGEACGAGKQGCLSHQPEDRGGTGCWGQSGECAVFVHGGTTAGAVTVGCSFAFTVLMQSLHCFRACSCRHKAVFSFPT